MLQVLAKYWWTFTLRGALAVAFGLAAFFWPALTLSSLVILFGAFVFADGVLAIVNALRGSGGGHRWVYLLEGLAGIGTGVLTFFWPGVTAVMLLMFVAAWAILTGISEIVAAVRLRKEIEGEWALGLSGLLSIGFGVALAARPGIGALAVTWLIGAYAIAFGIVLLVLGFRLKGLSRKVHEAIA